MRILRVAQRTYPEITGGGAYHVHAMSRDQASMGHDVTVLTIGDRGQEERDGYTVVRRPATAELLGNEISAGVGQYLRSHASEFDVVHAHSHLYFSTNLAALLRRLGGPPLALTNHGLYSQTAPERVFDVYLRTLGRWTFDTADVVFCYTGTDQERLRQLGVATDITVVPNGIDVDRFTPDGPQSDRIDTKSAVVLFVGRLVEGKRPGDAISAIAQLRELDRDVHLYLCGEGPLRQTLETQVTEEGVSDSVTFLGHVGYDEMPALYRQADVVVLPSLAEGLPRTVLESLACGVPVVCTDLDQMAPIVQDAGRLVPSAAPQALASSLDVLLSDAEERQRLGERGRQRVATNYSWEQTASQTTARLAQLVDPENYSS